MATKLFLRDTKVNAIGVFRDMLAAAGSSATTGATTSVLAQEIQLTKTGGGEALEWVSGRAPAGGFTLSGTMSFNIWAAENATAAQMSGRVRVYRRDSGGTEYEVAGGPWNDSVEFTKNTATEMSWTGDPSSGVAFSENERIVVRYFIAHYDGSTDLPAGYTGTLTYDSADAGTGDSFFQINENVTFKAEATSAIATVAGLAKASVKIVCGLVVVLVKKIHELA